MARRKTYRMRGGLGSRHPTPSERLRREYPARLRGPPPPVAPEEISQHAAKAAWQQVGQPHPEFIDVRSGLQAAASPLPYIDAILEDARLKQDKIKFTLDDAIQYWNEKKNPPILDIFHTKTYLQMPEVYIEAIMSA